MYHHSHIIHYKQIEIAQEERVIKRVRPDTVKRNGEKDAISPSKICCTASIRIHFAFQQSGDLTPSQHFILKQRHSQSLLQPITFVILDIYCQFGIIYITFTAFANVLTLS